MKNFKKLGLAVAVVAIGLMTSAGEASASNFTSSSGTTYTSEILATSTNMQLSGSFITVNCSGSSFKSKVEKHGGAINAGGAITSLTFTGCNYTVTVNRRGSMDVNSSGDFDLFGTEFTVATSVGTCIFSADSNWFGGTEVGYLSEGNPGVFHFAPGEIPRTGGNFLCGSDGHWTASYTVTTPAGGLWVD